MPSTLLPPLNYPDSLPVVGMREQIVAAIRENPVIVVVSETGSGKTTQLPKMVAEALAENNNSDDNNDTTDGKNKSKRPRLIGCTQPRRIAAASVSKRVAEELRTPLGAYVGYQVRFEDKTSKDTRIKFMTDGILLAETQGDADLRHYDALILDEAHERSLNIDFLLGYLKRLLEHRRDLKLIISSATLDAGSFSAFFDGAPVLQAEGRTFGVEEYFLPPDDDEELARQVPRAVDWLTEVDPQGDVLVFLPGEREIRDCADALDGRGYRNTEILPLFARLGLGDQQRIFNPGHRRRIILATNVAETSLTIPGIVSVVDSGLARVSRWSPARGVQRLQIEEVSQASARQRKGRCGRVREGVCVRLYSEENLAERPEFTDPEIRRSSLAGVILRMKSLGLPDIEDFPFLDPPAPKAISEGYRTLREVGALDKDKQLTDAGWTMARMPVDPRLARMLIEADYENCLAEILPIVSALESADPKERPAEKTKEADAAHAKWKDAESDFRGLLRLWVDLQRFREGRGWKRNQLRKYCGDNFLNYRRAMEWTNVHDELRDLIHRELRWEIKPLGSSVEKSAGYDALHRALLSGVPRQFGLYDKEARAYRSASGGHFAVFPGSGLFGGKKWDWVMAMELVDTTRLWARRVARIDPAWVEKVAPHLCTHRYGEGHWDEQHGAVYAKETVLCGGLPIVAGRRVHFGRIDPAGARRIFVREGLLQGGVKGKSRAISRIAALKEEIEAIEHKLRRVGGLWSEEAVLEFFESRLPQDMFTAKAYHKWQEKNGDSLIATTNDVVLEDLDALDLEGYPDSLAHGDDEYALYYRTAPGERDDGVTLGVHIDQLPKLPDWLPGWGVPGDMPWRAEWMIRSLPKDLRRECQPVADCARGFADEWRYQEPDAPLELRLAQYLTKFSGYQVSPSSFDLQRQPEELITKIWVCDDEGSELAFGRDVKALQRKLGKLVTDRFEAAANADWERRGMKEWTEGEIPEVVETPAGPAYPALLDEGGSVGVKAFSNPAEAAEAHRAGQVRLLMLAQPDQVAYLKKKFPLGLMAKVELPRLGTPLDDLIALSGEGALGSKRYSTPQDFAAAAKPAKGRWYEAASVLSKSLDITFDSIGPVRQWIHDNAKDRHLSAVASDLEEELAWLLRPRFAWRAGFARLKTHDRYLRGIRSRLGRIASLPLVKDLEKMERVRKYWTPWFRAWTAKPEDPALWDYGWLLEEYRLSLFAPDVPTEMKVSEKRLGEGF